MIAAAPPAPPGPVSVVVTNYDGLHNMQTFLPQVIERLAGLPGSEVLVVDDASTDESVPWLEANLPGVRVLRRERNEGFAVTANQGFAAARHDRVLLLSSDMVPAEGAIELLHAALDAVPDALCAGGVQVRTSGAWHSGRATASFRRGLVRCRSDRGPTQPPGGRNAVYHQLQTAAGLWRRAPFLDLGGFCPLLLPFFFEETDLCWRAWKQGWRILFHPDATIVHHHEHSSIGQHYSRRFARAQHKRHQSVMFWKNVTTPSWLVSNILWTAVRLPFVWLLGNVAFYQSQANLLGRRAEIGRLRRQLAPLARLTDDQVLERSLDDRPIPLGPAPGSEDVGEG